MMLITESPKSLITREGYIPLPDGMIWYQQTFSESSKHAIPLIIIHGGPGSNHYYLKNLTALATTRPVILYDQMGCGKSKKSKRSFTNLSLKQLLHDTLTDLEALISHLNYDKVMLLGHGWGGSMAIEYTRAHHKKIERLVLASPVLGIPVWQQDAHALVRKYLPAQADFIFACEESGTLNNPHYQGLIKDLYKQIVCRLPVWPQDLVETLEDLNPQLYEMWGPNECQITGPLKAFDSFNDLSKITVPTLITCGRYDKASPETMQRAIKNIKSAQLVIFEKSAHVAHLEEPAQYLATIKKFIT
jgi:proline iminopeptidase